MGFASQFAHLLAETSVKEKLCVAGLRADEGAAPGETLQQIIVHQARNGLTHRLAANTVESADFHFRWQHTARRDQSAFGSSAAGQDRSGDRAAQGYEDQPWSRESSLGFQCHVVSICSGYFPNLWAVSNNVTTFSAETSA